MVGKIFTIGLLLVVIGGGIWWVSTTTDGDGSLDSVPEDVASEESATEARDGTTSLRDLMLRGESVECTFTIAEDDGTIGTGVGYFSEEQARVDSELVDADGFSYEVSYIFSDDRVYTWGTMLDGQQFAVSMLVDDEHELDVLAEEDDDMLGIDDEIEYSCQPWRVDTSVFVPPADIEFMDMTSMLQQQMMEIDTSQMDTMLEGLDPDQRDAALQQMQEAGIPVGQ